MIQFDQTTHRFSLRGETVPSVTQILKAEGFVDERWYTSEGRDRGQDVHAATALLDAGQLDWTTITPSVAQYVLSYEKAKAELRFSIKGIERIVSKGSAWAGIVDRVVLFNRKLTVVDLKTGSPKVADKLQVVAYGATFARLPQLMLLYLRPEGYRAEVLEEPTVDEFRMMWHHIVSVYHWRRKWKA